MNIHCSTSPDGGFQDCLTILQTHELSPKRVRNVTQITYSSAIAHRLMPQYQRSAATIAADITTALNQLLHQQNLNQLKRLLPLSLPTAAFQYLQIRATPTGFVQIKLMDAAIAQWLDFLIQDFPDSALKVAIELETPQNYRQNPAIFALQHAHARCCSLLRLAHREGLIELNQPEDSPMQWRFIWPDSIPWLTAAAELQLNQPGDRPLISQLLAAFEDSVHPNPPSSPTALRLAADLSWAFEQCHRQHQPWAESHQPSAATIAYLGLLLATQRVLHQLLTLRLNLQAPSEL